MSTITNEAIIKVSTDATGVEEGNRRIDASAARTGKNLENLGATAQKTGKSLETLGSAPGLRNVGEGAGAAAGQVDRATKSMAESIQRATATMNAGAKGSAAYYEALANSRGLNIATLRPYLDQLDAVTRKTQQAAAAQRQLDAGNNFLAGLRAQADGIGKTASQLAALRAEELGVADAARPLIEQLQAAEEAASNAGSSVSGFSAALASVASGATVAAIAQLSDEYGAYLGQLKLATSGQAEFANAQAATRRIAATAQSDLSATGALYASITKGTRDLGIAQRQVADITEVVSLGLKVSNASAQASASAIYQLTQAFGMGVLRGEEFNAVNEASPRLMQALADGIGVPVGALRAMAEQGALTTDVLANALPRALATLRTEAKSVESIGGAVTVLKNNLLELVGSTAQSNGAVSVLSGSIGLLADNLVLVGGVVATGALAKLGSMFGVAATKAYENVAASRALAAANLATANTNVAATAAASATAAARVNELRAAVLAAEGNAALAIATNGLIPAQARAAAAAAAHTAALTAQAAAARAASVSITAARGALALVGGPVGAVITVLGLAATAWAVWGNEAEKANDKAAESTEESTADMIARLDEQIAKLRERNALAATEPRIKALDGISEVDKDGLARAKAALDANKAAQAAAGNDARARMMLQLEEVELSGKYEAALGRVKALQGEVAVAAARTRGERLDDWYAKNGTAAQRLAAELESLKKEFGTIPPEMEKLVRAKFADPTATKAITDQAKAAKEYADLLARINGKSLGVDSDYQENLAKLAAGYKAGKQTLAEYTETLEKYNAQQPRALQAAKDLSDFQEGYAKSQAAYTAVLDKRLQDAETEATRNEELARTYGMTKSAIEQLEIARLEEQLAQRSTLGLTLTEIENIEKLIDVKKRNSAAINAMEQADAAKKAAEEWKRASDSIEQSLTDALLRGFESGNGFGKNLVETLKNMFGTLVLRPIISPIINPVAAGLTNALGLGGAASAATGAAGGAGLGVGGMLAGIGSGAMQTAGAFLTGQIGFGSTLSAGAAAIGTGSMAGITAGLSSVVGVLGPIALGIGAAVKAFGRGPKEYNGNSSIEGSFGADGLDAAQFAEWKKKGGWFSSSKTGRDRFDLSGEMSASLTSAYDAIKASSADFAEVLGLNAASIATRSQTIKIALGKDEAANQAAIAEFFAGVANTVAAELLPEIGKFQVQGEQASATLQRLAVNFSAVDQILVAMGASSEVAFRAVGAASIEARERLLAFAGGVDALASATTFFNDNFLTEAERVAIIQKPLQEGLAALGYASLTTADQYKEAVQQLVSSGALATEQGAKQYAGLLALGPQFKTVSDYLKSVGDAAAEIARQAAEAAKGAEEAAKRAADAARQAALEQAAGLVSGVDSAFSVLQRVVDRQKKALQEEISVRTASIQKIEALSQSLRSTLDGMTVSGREAEDRRAAQAQIEAALAIAKASGKLPSAEDLRSALSVVSRDSSALFASQEDYLRDFYATRIGIEDLAGLTDDALSVEERSLKRLEDQVKQYDLMLEREQEQIDVLKGLSITGLSIEQAIQALRGAMQAASANPVNSATSAISDAYKSALGRAPDQAGLDYWKDRAAGGISTGAIVDSIKNSPEAQIQALYKDVFGRPADAVGLNYWIDRLQGGISLGAIRDTFESSDEAKKKLRGFAVGTNYIPVDMPAMVHQGERIIPAADNRELMRRLASPEQGSASLAAEIRMLREEVAALRSAADRGAEAAERTAGSTGQLADQFDNATDGGNAMRADVINTVQTREIA